MKQHRWDLVLDGTWFSADSIVVEARQSRGLSANGQWICHGCLTTKCHAAEAPVTFDSCTQTTSTWPQTVKGAIWHAVWAAFVTPRQGVANSPLAAAAVFS